MMMLSLILWCRMALDSISYFLHKWPRDYVLKTSRQEVSSSILGHACRPSIFGVFRGFHRISHKYGLDFLRRSQGGRHFPQVPCVNNWIYTEIPKKKKVRNFSFNIFTKIFSDIQEGYFYIHIYFSIYKIAEFF